MGFFIAYPEYLGAGIILFLGLHDIINNNIHVSNIHTVLFILIVN